MTTTPSSAPSGDDRLRVLYGDPALAPPERTPLRAGPLTLVYTDLGDLRYIRYGRHEIVRRLYHAVRNETWGTVIPEITIVEREIGEDSFRIVYDSRHTDSERGIDFRARVTLTGGSDGTIVYDFDGEALSTFRRNRIGICVLHPAQDCKARMLHVKHTDGSVEKGAFPDTISPHQPFFDITELAHEIGDTGAQATLTFAGDVFEMEDQRNWLDASFKTYSTPLALPMPVEVPTGTCIRQTVRLSITGISVAPQPPISDDRVEVTIGERIGRALPWFGLQLSDTDLESNTSAAERLRALSLYNLRYDLDAGGADWQTALPAVRAHLLRLVEEGIASTASIGVKNAERILPVQDAAFRDVWPLLVTPTSADINRLQSILRPRNLQGKGYLHGCWPVNFTELNRADEQVKEKLGVLCFGGNPQVHAFDSLSIMETPPMLAEAFSSLDGKLASVGPLTFYGRYRPEDPRQTGLIAAAWYAAALAYAIPGGAEHITLCEPTGPRGLVAADGTPYPAYHVIAAICAHTARSVRSVVSAPLRAAFLAMEDQQVSYEEVVSGHLYGFAVNLTDTLLNLRVSGLRSEQATVRLLDETCASEGFSEVEDVTTPDGQLELTLPAYGIAEIASPLERPFPIIGSFGSIF